MKKIHLTLASYLFASICLNAATRDWDDWKQNDFQSGYLEPFVEDQGFTGSEVLNEGFSFVSGPNTRTCRITWKESEYDGSRRERGHEIKPRVNSDYVVYSGWEWYFPNSSNNLMNKDTIVWQMYCWNSAGCSNWTAHMSLDGNDLEFDYRGACVTPNTARVKSNLSYNKWYQIACALRPGSTTGLFVCKIDQSTVLDIRNINVGFGGKNSDGSLQDAVIGIKMGLYCAETSDYTNNETRKVYLNNMSAADRDNGANASTSWARVEPW